MASYTWDWSNICAQNSSTFYVVVDNWLTECAEQIVVVCPVYVLQAVVCAYLIGRSTILTRSAGGFVNIWTTLRGLCTVCLMLQPALHYSLARVFHNVVSPVDSFTYAVVTLSWFLHTCVLYRLRYVVTASAFHPLLLTYNWLLTLMASTLKFVSVILNDRSNSSAANRVNDVDRYVAYTELALQILYFACTIIGALVKSRNDYTLSINPDLETTPILSEHRAGYHTLPAYRDGAGQEPLGVAASDSNCLSKLLFWWVRPLMVKGYMGKLNSHTDLFDLPPSVTTSAVSTRFQQNYNDCHAALPCTRYMSTTECAPIHTVGSCDDWGHATSSRDHNWEQENDRIGDGGATTTEPRRVVSLMRALNRSFGLEYYSLGVLKFLGDACGFLGPILLHELITFMENTEEPARNGYLYATGLMGSTLLGAMLSVHFSYRVSLVSMKVRAALVTSVYKKSVQVSLDTMATFNTGEIVNFMSSDTDRIVNFCNSFHQFWSLPFQISISLYLLHQQVGLAFLAGLGFAILLIPVNRWIAIKIMELSKSMMHHKDSRVKVINELLHGIRVIKFYAWESYFMERINSMRQSELRSLKGRKYLDALCVYFWATTPVLISILTFSTYALMGNKLTAAKVFTSLALFNMLIAPLNAFPWVINGLMEAWVSLERVQAFLRLTDLQLSSYYSPMIVHGADKDKVVSIRNGAFRWSHEKLTSYSPGADELTASNNEDYLRQQQSSTYSSMLSHLCMDIHQGQLIGIVGKIGSGKSSLLYAMLGEMERIHGTISSQALYQGFGYAAQEAWIQHGTLRDNIQFGSRYDASRYWAAIDACCLLDDLKILPAGDQTEIGENGVTLSGGQKARVALARAIYQEMDIYLLDDPLSAVDAQVGAHIFKQCIMGVLCKKTRILCTHHLQYMQFCDLVVALDRGKIVKYGPPSVVLQNTDFLTSISTLPSSSSLELQMESEEVESDESKVEGEVLVQDEEKEVGVVKMQIYLVYWKAVGHCLAASVLFSLLFMQASRNISDWWLAFWVSHSHASGLMHVPGNLSTELPRDTTSVLLWQSSSSDDYLSYGRYIGIMKYTSNNIMTTLYVLGDFLAPVSFFDATPIGRIVNRFSSDVYSVDDSLPFIMNILLAQLYGLAGTISITCYGLPWFSLLLLPLAAIYYHIQKYYRHTSRELKRLASVTLSPVYAHFSETLTGLASIRAFRATARFMQENQNTLEINQKANFAGQVASQWLNVRLQLLGVVMVTGVAFITVLEHHYQSVNTGLVGLAISYALSVTNLLSGVISSFTETEKQMVSVERAQQYIADIASERHEGLLLVSESWPSEGVVKFQNVRMAYKKNLPAALDGVSFETRAGEKLGIVGRTGSGKSSLFLALFRMVELQSGSITVDGVLTKLLSLKELRSKLAIIPQDPFLFSGTVRENLDPTEQFAGDQLWEVLDACHLADKVHHMGGLESEVSERGKHFSVGQRQLMCLARALLTGAKVLCIDEATASVDFETDQLIQQTIRAMFADSTVMTIAHRINTVEDSDRVLVMSGGKVVELATPADLLKNKQSHFYSLVHGKL
ncbi:PREDICTED: multidrug resistance-associated protein 7-like [Priapulus caudatus]|uniref:Multidrug resistance-associated protein 7-like n=1 Tax=Priapulus caudatus TaxID=37621 RepID=A0ABM1DTI8_PRICU|nr:PREDICTED: multidrug resistance-associated protein 7-like [Priapulus caudatus]